MKRSGAERLRWIVATVGALSLLAYGAVNGDAAGVRPGLHGKTAQVAATDVVLHRFTGGKDGANPVASLIVDIAGAVYGTTQSGGSHGAGTVFKLTPVGGGYRGTILYNFRGGSDGASPAAGLIADERGALYGTTSAGGACAAQRPTGCGTVYKLTPSAGGYVESVLYRFKGGADGSDPTGSVALDRSGTLYGSTSAGGAGYGTVYALQPSGWNFSERIVYRFRGGADGATPIDGNGLLEDASGSLYGTTFGGGSTACSSGCGTVFVLARWGNNYAEHVLHRFANTDGANPAASLIADATGALYGTTMYGGTGNCLCGLLFKLDVHGNESVLHEFTGASGDGFEPSTQLTADGSGALYGTTALGGSCGVAPFYTCGDAFAFVPGPTGYTESILANFQGGSDGLIPRAALVRDANGVFYGTTEYGGGSTGCTAGCGTVFKIVR